MDDANRRGTAREWLAARIVIVGGFAIAIAVAAYFTLRPAPPPVAEQQPQQSAAPLPNTAEANAKAGMMVCAQELMNAKNSGIVPTYGQLANALPVPTRVRGRYVCTAATNVGKYLIAADLICRDLTDSRCVSLYSITGQDGTVLYKRPG